MSTESGSLSYISSQPGTSTSSQESEDTEAIKERARSRAGWIGGTEVLNSLSGLVVKQRMEVLEVLTGIDMNNKYDVCATAGGLLFFAYEQSPCLMRICAGRRRLFTIHVTDFSGQEFIRIRRKCKCCVCCSDNLTKLCACLCCCREMVAVESPPGSQIGSVCQTCGTWLRFDVNDASGRIAKISGPSCCGMGCCTCCFPSKVFAIYANNGKRIGSITKKFGGIFKELLTNADVFHVEFPIHLSVHGKALLLSAVFLIDFIAFEENPREKLS